MHIVTFVVRSTCRRNTIDCCPIDFQIHSVVTSVLGFDLHLMLQKA